jgi:CheY-like chemotaxis protein
MTTHADASARTDPHAAVRALVVDDNHGAARMMALALEVMGAVVAIAHDGESAVAVAREFQPHITFMDLSMSGMDGREAARRIRAERQRCEVFLVAVSGWPRDDVEAMGGILDFDDYLPKPAALSQLREMLDQCMRRRH